MDFANCLAGAMFALPPLKRIDDARRAFHKLARMRIFV